MSDNTAPHIAARLYGAPLAVASDKLETLLTVLEPKVLRGETITAIPGADTSRLQERAALPSMTRTRAGTSVASGGVAVISVVGTTVHRGSFVDAMSGLASYSRIQGAVADAMADPEVTGVILDLDTPGGEVSGLFDAATGIRDAATAAGKPLWAVANDAALSAGYALAATADRVWTSRTAFVGSIGVVAVHLDRSKADQQAGLDYTFVHAGKHKVEGHQHAPLPDAARERLQARVDETMGIFVSYVAERRGLAEATVRGFEALYYRGAQAVALGLADTVGSLSEAVAAMRTESAGASKSKSLREEKTMSENLKANPAPDTDAPAEDPAAESAVTPAPAAQDASVQAAPAADAGATIARTEAAEIASVVAQANKIGVTVDMVKVLETGQTADDLRRSVLEAAAKRAADTAVSTAHAPAGVADTPDDGGWGAAARDTFGAKA